MEISYFTVNKFKTLFSADCQKMMQCDVPIYDGSVIDLKSIKEASGKAQKAFAVDGPSGVELSFSETLDEDSQRGLFALMIMRRLFQSQMLVKEVVMIGMGLAVPKG